jgi:transposase-like protein
LLIICLDGVIFGDHHVPMAVGADEEGKTQVLGLATAPDQNKILDQ